jgi:cytosine/adenosine deaminase-related metal-dependent hydrolase
MKIPMPTVLVKNIEYLATFDDARREIRDGALLVRDNVIEHVGTTAQFGSLAADRVLDLAGYIVMPGMVNTHHHMSQNLTPQPRSWTTTRSMSAPGWRWRS